MLGKAHAYLKHQTQLFTACDKSKREHPKDLTPILDLGLGLRDAVQLVH